MIFIEDALLGPDGSPDYVDGDFVEITMDWRRIDGSTTGTDKTVPFFLTATGLRTGPLYPGPAIIRAKLGKSRTSSRWPVFIPEGSGARSLFDLIGPAVEIPDSTPAAIIAKAVSDHLTANPPTAGPTIAPLQPDSTRDGFFTIPAGSSITEDPNRPGVFLIGA